MPNVPLALIAGHDQSERDERFMTFTPGAQDMTNFEIPDNCPK